MLLCYWVQNTILANWRWRLHMLDPILSPFQVASPTRHVGSDDKRYLDPHRVAHTEYWAKVHWKLVMKVMRYSRGVFQIRFLINGQRYDSLFGFFAGSFSRCEALIVQILVLDLEVWREELCRKIDVFLTGQSIFSTWLAHYPGLSWGKMCLWLFVCVIRFPYNVNPWLINP